MLKIGICDDSSEYIEVFEFKLRKALDDITLEAEIIPLKSLEALKAYASSAQLDIVYLDVMFGEENAIDFCIKNMFLQKMQIVFMTEFPYEAYNISETRHSYFLVKSRTTDEMLKNSLRKVISKLSEKSPDTMTIKSGSAVYKINTNDILYIEGVNNNIQLHMKDKQIISLYETLKSFSQKLPHYFYHYHRSFIVNLNHIEKAQPYEFILSNGEAITIPSRRFNKIVQKYIDYINLF